GFTGKSGMMPPRGTCANCSDEEIENAIHYMIDKL
ncbi:MAG: c-type cytochrome, partial [Aeromonas veronii]